MEIPIFKILERLEPLPSKDINKLFSASSLIINKKHLLSLWIKKISIESAIFKEDPDSKVIFTPETLKMVIEDSFICEKFSKKMLLNIFANQNSDLIKFILDTQTFTKIYLINDIMDFDSDFLNLSQNNNICLKLLEDKSLNGKIRLKYLVDDGKGETNLGFLEHLEKCDELLNWKKFEESKRFVLDVFGSSELRKIRKQFPMKKIVSHLLYSTPCPPPRQIDTLICLNEDFVDSKILKKILSCYCRMEDENRLNRFQQIFGTNNSFYFSNKDIASWIYANQNLYFEGNYYEIKDLISYSFHDDSIYQWFCKNKLFIENLVDYAKLIEFLEKIDFSDFNLKTISFMFQFILIKRTNVNFKKMARNPRKTLFKMKRFNLKGQMESDFLAIEPFEIFLEFGETVVKTSLKELLDADDWDNLADFHNKIKNKEINLNALIGINLRLENEIFKSLGTSKASVKCCICLDGGENKELHIFDVCSHIICWKCFDDYLISKGLLLTKTTKNGNKVRIDCQGRDNKMQCPNCRLETFSNNSITLIKLFC